MKYVAPDIQVLGPRRPRVQVCTGGLADFSVTDLVAQMMLTRKNAGERVRLWSTEPGIVSRRTIRAISRQFLALLRRSVASGSTSVRAASRRASCVTGTNEHWNLDARHIE